MRAVQFDQYGAPEVLHLAEAEEPHAGPGQVRIRVAAAAVNPMDWKIRSGAMADTMPRRLPWIPGLEAAGAVDEVGEGVAGVSIGDRVFGAGSATTAELAVLDAFARIPRGLGVIEAAALPVAVETSARVLDLLDLQPGQLVVVEGAGGGVGTTLVQLAVARDLRVVGTASQSGHDLLRELGARATTYGEGLAERVLALTDQPVAAGIDLVGKGGVAGLAAMTGDPAKVVTIADFGTGDLGVQVTDGSQGRAWYSLREAAALVQSGRLRVILDTVLPWEQAARAHELSESGHARGKIVLGVG